MNPTRKIELAKDTLDKQDFDSLIEWLKTYPRLTKGEKTIEFERKWSEKVGTKYCVYVNSGSSANLLMIYAMIASGRMKNKKVAVPALSWVTDVSPIMQFGLEPILIDCNKQNLAVDIDDLEEAFRLEQPSALLLVSVLGMVPDMQAITALCEKYDVALLLDNCEGIGSKYKEQMLEKFAVMSSCSLYFGHTLSSIEGGTICTDDKEMYDLLKMLRSHGWDRDLDAMRQAELREKHDVDDFSALYTFYEAGFNVRATDLQAFLGIRQIDKWDWAIGERNKIFNVYQKLIRNPIWKPVDYSDRFVSALGYPVIHPKREAIVKELCEAGVEVRPLISGSMGMQPFFAKEYGMTPMPNACDIDAYGFYCPVHPYMTTDDVLYICNIINHAIHGC